MSEAPVKEIISVDWGTTSLRATLVTGGEPGATVRGSTGVRGRDPGELARALDEVIVALPETSGPIVLSGMIGSTAGLLVAPYADAPAGRSDIARSITHVPRELLGPICADREVVIVPGVRYVTPSGAELMRGEETQVLGQNLTEGVVIAPGSHSKWITVSGGRIEAFATAMTGEVYAAIGAHTLLSDSLTPGLAVSGEYRDDFLRGIDDAQSGDLLFTLFSVRAKAIAGAGHGSSTARLSGLVVGAELRDGLARAGHPSHVTVIADHALAEWYDAALSNLGITATIADDQTAARGAWRLAQEGWPR